nr:MAG TPA: hypothetical protein [Caudoviricetes sp.]
MLKQTAATLLPLQKGKESSINQQSVVVFGFILTTYYH